MTGRNAMGPTFPPAGALGAGPRGVSQPERIADIIPRALAALGVTIEPRADDERDDPQLRRRPA